MTRALGSRVAVSAALTVLVALLSVQQVAAGALSFSLKGGRVTILAYSVTVREILSEWERFGGVTIVGSDALGGAPITLELRDVPEAKALDVLLRSVSGYVAVSRDQPVAAGSIFQSIRILPTSRAPILPPPVRAEAVLPRPPMPTAFVPPTGNPAAAALAPNVPGVLVSGSNVAAGDVAPRFVPLTPVEQAGVRQNQQALQEFLTGMKAANSTPASTTISSSAASTDASRPGSITPYTPPSNQRPAAPAK